MCGERFKSQKTLSVFVCDGAQAHALFSHNHVRGRVALCEKCGREGWCPLQPTPDACHHVVAGGYKCCAGKHGKARNNKRPFRSLDLEQLNNYK